MVRQKLEEIRALMDHEAKTLEQLKTETLQEVEVVEENNKKLLKQVSTLFLT